MGESCVNRDPRLDVETLPKYIQKLNCSYEIGDFSRYSLAQNSHQELNGSICFGIFCV